MKPKTNRRQKNRDIDKDTVVAYHELIQGKIQDNLNGISIGPGHLCFKLSIASAIFAFCCLIVGILVVSLRHRHVYLVNWNEQFLGPFFIILALLFFGFSTFLCLLAKQRTNQYRADLAFRPIGDYGVAVVHKSKLTYDEQKKSELKSGTTPHNVRHPGRPGVNDRGNRGDYSKSRGYDNRGYKDDYYGEKRRPDRHENDRGRRDYDRDHRDGRGPDDRPRRPREDGDRPRRPREEGDRPPRRPREDGDRPPRRPDDRGPPRRPDDRGPPRRPDDRDRERRRPPPGSEEEKRREAGRRRYEEEKRRRYEEERRRAELRKEAEAASVGSEERGVDVDGTRTYQVQTTVKLSRQIQETDESEL